MDSLRVSELAKELNMSSKDLIDKFAEISISVKSHSNTVTPEQIRKIKEHLGVAPKKNTAKKAFIVKKAKTPSQEPEVVKTETTEAPRVERIERVQRVEKAPQLEVVEKALDVNKDGTVNIMDITILRRYNAGGYDIVLQ